MNAEILSIGTELVRGFTVDRNASFLARELESIGISVSLHHTVGDDHTAGVEILRRALVRCDLVIATGGLGPTGDDITREMVRDACGIELAHDETAWNDIHEWLIARGIAVESGHRKQAMLPVEGGVLSNRLGTAPGFLVTSAGGRVAVLPGVPREMRVMFLEELRPRLAALAGAGGSAASTRVLRMFGLPESRVGEILRPWFSETSDPQAGITASRGLVGVYLTSRAEQESERERRIGEVEALLRRELGASIFGVGSDDLASVVGRELIRRGLTIGVAESCTGGLLARMLTDVADISEVFLEGAVTYSNEAKVRTLGVDPSLLERHGAVSEAVARGMAEGIAKRAHAAIGIGITGIAGPRGGTEEKPVGLVYIGVSYQGRAEVIERRFGGDRDVVRLRSALTALDAVRRRLLDERPA